MITAKSLIEIFKFAMDENWGYIWGAYGQLWTKEKQAGATDEKARLYGEKWIGHRVADCSGLGYWAFSELGGYIFHGSNTIWNEYVTDRCELKDGKRTDGKPLYPGDPVFLKKVENGKVNRHHIGYYVGGDTVIEAKGTQWGVVTSPLSRWHETARWYNVLYDNGAYYGKMLTLKRGMRGEQVKLLQEALNELPAGAALDLKVDGIFGAETEKAVRQFQADHGLTVDGVVGKKTWAALGVTAPCHPEQSEETPSAEEHFADVGNTSETAPGDTVAVERMTLKALYAQAAAMAGTLKKIIEGE